MIRRLLVSDHTSIGFTISLKGNSEKSRVFRVWKVVVNGLPHFRCAYEAFSRIDERHGSCGFRFLGKALQPLLGCPANDFAHREINLLSDAPHFLHQWIGEKDLELLHGSMISMDEGGLKL